MTEAKKKLWFRAKSFGWGWVPISWQGWLVTLVYVLVLVWPVLRLDPKVHSASDFFITYATVFIPATILLFLFCYTKGERPKWRWNLKEAIRLEQEYRMKSNQEQRKDNN